MRKQTRPYLEVKEVKEVKEVRAFAKRTAAIPLTSY